MSAATESVVLPFYSEWAGFGLSSTPGSDGHAAVELACVCFDRDGRVLDAIAHSNSNALNGALKHSSDARVPATDRVPADEAIHMSPFHFAPECEATVLVASAPSSSCRRSDLGTASRLEFRVSARQKGAAAAEQLLTIDLLPLVLVGKEGATTPLSNGHQSLIIGAVYTTPQGWTFSADGTTSAADCWGAMLPQLRECLQRLPGVLAGGASRTVEGEAAEAAAVFTRPGEDRPLLDAGGGASPSQLRLDVGWTLWKTAADAEDTAPEFTVASYNLQGEELAAVTVAGEDCPEAEGIQVLEAPPEPEEGQEGDEEGVEAEKRDPDEHQQEEDEEEDEAGEEQAETSADGGQEEGEDGASGEAAAAAGEGQTATAAAAVAAPPKPPLEPIKPFNVFPLKRQVLLTLSELPAGTRSVALSVANFGGAGFRDVATLQVRLLDASTKPSHEHHSRPLLALRVNSSKGEGEGTTQVLMFKLYKEPANSAYSVWTAAGSPSLESLVEGTPPSERLIADAVAAAKADLSAEAAAKAAAEEAGEDPEGMPPAWLGSATWRWRAWCLLRGGGSADAVAEELQGLLAYEGGVDADGRRSDATAKAVYPNRDTYFGGYRADVKSGDVGLYLFATAAAYLGAYQGGKRHGQGVLVMPDGGTYRGAFAADRFDGQGTYKYPDGSCYHGAWQGGLRHGRGTYWDTTGGCLHGTWAAGTLQGTASYDQPHYSFKGQWVKGVPAGPCTFTMSSVFRTEGLPATATAHLLASASNGPTLAAQGTYAIPAGAGAAVAGDDEDQGGGPALPAFPKYEGLSYRPHAGAPHSVADVAFPPADVLARP